MISKDDLKGVLKPMPVGVLFQLRAGDRYRVFWAKDDNPLDVRLDYKILTVESNDSGKTINSGSYEWYLSEVIRGELHTNELDTSRGIAYFYYP